jgi:hypothetical protein
MAAFVPSVGLFLLTSPEHRRQLWRPGFWVMCVVGGLGALPILVWNVQNGWVTFHHVNSLAGMKQDNPIHWFGPFAYVGGQFALLLGFWFVAWASAMIVHRPWRETDAGMRYLWWTSMPMFGVFLAFSFKTGGGELNWPVTAYLSGLVLATAWLARQLNSPVLAWRRLSQVSLGLSCLLGLLLTLAVHRSDLFRPVLLSVSGPASPQRPFPLRRFDPSCRLKGWRDLASEIDRVRQRVRRGGNEPIVAATSWAIPGEVGFYCDGHPTVYNIGRVQGDRHSQYDLWRPNPLADPEAFRGRTFLIVGPVSPAILAGFEKTVSIQTIYHVEAGQPIGGWSITVCKGFKGFPLKDERGSY